MVKTIFDKQITQKNEYNRNKKVMIKKIEKKFIRVLFINPLSVASNFSKKLPKFINKTFDEDKPDANEQLHPLPKNLIKDNEFL